MILMSTITRTPIIIAVLAIASLFVAGPVSMSMDELNVYANKKSYTASQDLSQGELSEQSSESIFREWNRTASDNNVDLSFNLNDGQNALGQQ